MYILHILLNDNKIDIHFIYIRSKNTVLLSEYLKLRGLIWSAELLIWAVSHIGHFWSDILSRSHSLSASLLHTNILAVPTGQIHHKWDLFNISLPPSYRPQSSLNGDFQEKSQRCLKLCSDSTKTPKSAISTWAQNQNDLSYTKFLQRDFNRNIWDKVATQANISERSPDL